MSAASSSGEEHLSQWLRGLNDEQRRAVETTQGPLLILAGAGSGKTRVLTRRIAHLLSLGVPPQQILAVTFTNKAASEMRARVIELAGEPGEKVWMSTFHSACCRILRADIEPLGWTTRFAIYDDDDQLRLLKQIVADAGYDPKILTPKSLLSRIDWYKTRLISVENVIRQKRSHINDPLIQVWQAYEQSLQAADALDFNDLIGATVRLLRDHAAVRERWQERFHYVMVDEYQDTNRSQYDLLSLLVARHRNLAVVGDDDQSIYGFRGADVSIIRGFQNDYPEVTTVRLERNYRSSSNILKLANAVISADPDRIGKNLWTDAALGPRVQLITATDPSHEAKLVARMCAELERNGHRWSDLAIIYRTNAISRSFEAALVKERIPYKLIGGRKFYERREVRDALAYLRLVTNPVDDAAFLRVVNVPPRGIGAKTLAGLRDEAVRRGEPLLRAARTFGGSGKAAKGLLAFVALIDALAERAREVEPDVLVAESLVTTGYREMLAGETDASGKPSRESAERLANLDELVRDASQYQAQPEQYTPLDRLVGWLDRVALTGATDDLEPEAGTVTLMTVHNSKGLEYPVVFVVHMMEGLFPHARSIEDDSVSEERRLAYVAFTRAEQRLIITRSSIKPSFGDNSYKPPDGAEPSRFLFDLPDDAVSGDRPDATPAMAETLPTAAALDRARAQSGLATFKAKLPSTQKNPAQRAPDGREAPVATRGTARVAPQVQPQATPKPAADLGYHTLVDVEDPQQLTKGTRVLIDGLGLGSIDRVTSTGVRVRTDTSGMKQLPFQGARIQIVRD